jgi:CheY-like chemotaxis protein
MPTTVLCVDDSPTIRSLVKKTLEPEGFVVVEANNGEVALEKARDKKPDLAIVDVNMPVMDGFQFVEACKADASPRFGTHRLLDDREFGREEGTRQGAGRQRVDREAL